MIPLPWKIIGAALILAGVWFHGNHSGASRVMKDWKAEVAAANLKAVTDKAELDAKNAAKDAAQAQQTRNLDAKYQQALSAIESGRSDFERRLVDRVRRSQADLARCKLSASAADPGGVSGDAAPGDIEFRGIDIAGVQRVRTVGLELQELVKQCHAWMAQNGR